MFPAMQKADAVISRRPGHDIPEKNPPPYEPPDYYNPKPNNHHYNNTADLHVVTTTATVATQIPRTLEINQSLTSNMLAQDRQKAQFQAILDRANHEFNVANPGRESRIETFNSQYSILTVADLLKMLESKDSALLSFRSVHGHTFHLLSMALTPIEVIGGAIAGAAEEVFAPSAHIFSAVMYLVDAARGVSALYDDINGLFQQLSFFTGRLQSYVGSRLSPALQDLIVKIMVTLFEVIVVSTRVIRKGRLKAFFKNLIGGHPDVQEAIDRLSTLTGAELSQVSADVLHGVTRVENAVNTGFQDTMGRVDSGFRDMRDDMRDAIADLKMNLSPANLKREGSLHGDTLKSILQPYDYTTTKYLDICRSATRDTGSWIMGDFTVREWASCRYPLLFMYGGAGVGKSFLVAHLITKLKDRFNLTGNTTEKHNSLGYFFFRNDNPETRSVHQALCDMAYQLAEDDHFYAKYLLKTIHHADDIKDVSTAFTKLMVNPMRDDMRGRKIYLVFDGLDEADLEDIDKLLWATTNLNLRSKIQVLVTGRPEMLQPIDKRFPEDDPIMSRKLKRLEITPARNRFDVAAYIHDSFRRNSKLSRRMHPELQKKAIRAIIDKSDGLFIMATLMIADIVSKVPNRAAIEQSLEQYPTSVNDLLHNVLEDFAKTLEPSLADELNELLLWVTCAEETLTLGQVEAILTLKSGYSVWGLESSLRGNYSSFFTLDREDGMTTTGLVEKRNAMIKQRDGVSPSRGEDIADDLNFVSNRDMTDVVFFHASLGDFFRSDASTNISPIGGCPIGFDENEALVKIAKTCLRIFIEPDFCLPDCERLKVYAGKHWLQHVVKINLSKTPTADKVDLINFTHKMLSDMNVVYTWTSFHCKKPASIFRHDLILGLQKLLQDSGVTNSLSGPVAAWAQASAKNYCAIVEPVGRIFARAWLNKDYSMHATGVHKSTADCYKIVRSIAYLNHPQYTWLSEEDDTSLSIDVKIHEAVAWAAQPKTAWWHLRLGSTFMGVGDYAKALHHYEQAPAIGGDFIETSARKAVCYQRQHRYQESLDLFLDCEKRELELMETASVNGHQGHIEQRWRLYQDQFYAAQCLVHLGRIDEAASYYRKAIHNAFNRSKFEAEIGYMGLMIKHNKFKEITTLLQEMNKRESDPTNSKTRLVKFLVQQATEPEVLEWIPRTACWKDSVPFARQQYRSAIDEAKSVQDAAAEFSLQLGRGLFHIYERDYGRAVRTLEDMCLWHYRPKGSLPIRRTQTRALRKLAYTYKQIALHCGEYGPYGGALDGGLDVVSAATTAFVAAAVGVAGGGVAVVGAGAAGGGVHVGNVVARGRGRGIWTQKLEDLEVRIRDHQNLDIPLQFFGQSHNDASMYLGLLKRKGGFTVEARRIFRPLVLEALTILDDDEPQNDVYALDNLSRVLMAAGETRDATALVRSMRRVGAGVTQARVIEVEGEDDVYSASGRREPWLPGILGQGMFCMVCLDTVGVDDKVGVCGYCLDPVCLRCLERVRGGEFDKAGFLEGMSEMGAVGRFDGLTTGDERGRMEGGENGFNMGVLVESSCRSDHEWVIVEPLGKALRPGQILCEGEVSDLTVWKQSVKEKWQ